MSPAWNHSSFTPATTLNSYQEGHTTYPQVLVRCVHSPSHHSLDVPDCGEHLLHHHLVLAVEVASHQRAAVVAYYHTVRIQHWDDLEYKLTS